MKKILYLFLKDKENERDTGVVKKAYSQKKALEELGYEVCLTYRKNNKFFINETQLNLDLDSFIGKIKNKICFSRHVRKEILNQDFDFIYIRKPLINKGFISLLKELKNKDKKIVLEIPTYPYDSEVRGFIQNLSFLIEKYYRKDLKNYIDLITYYGKAKEKIWGVSALELQNGISINNSLIFEQRENLKVINFVAVANISLWHGYDRFIQSLAFYKEQNNKIRLNFHIVGNGPELANLKKLVKELSLNENIVFHGTKVGKELEKILISSDIGVDSLGRHRSGNNHNSSLKSKEYLAHGLPVIKSHIDTPLEGSEYLYNVLPKDEKFSLKEIVIWYENNKFKKNEIKKYAEQNFDWKHQFEKVVKKLEEVNGAER